jgi:menaquinone-9 beta-reductase
MRFDAAVIGSGPAGATAARLLAQAGWRVALIERAAFPRRKVCGEFISTASVPVLEACGVAADFLSRAGPAVYRLAAYSAETMVDKQVPQGMQGWGRALGREHLDELLRDAAVAAGATLIQPAEVIALSGQVGQHVLRLRVADAADEIRTRVVIAACGSWNTSGSFAVSGGSLPTDLFGFKAHFRGAALADDVMPLLAFPGGYGGMVHSDGGRVTLSCCIRRDALARARKRYGGKAGEAVFCHVLASTKGARRALQDATIEDSILATGPIRPGARRPYFNGIFFSGNIAGEAHPIIAEGISMAIQSSWLLAQQLIADGPAAAPVAGPKYAREWKRHFAGRLRAASIFAKLAMSDGGRPVAAQLIRIFPTALTWGAALSGKSAPLTMLTPLRSPEIGIGSPHDTA